MSQAISVGRAHIKPGLGCQLYENKRRWSFLKELNTDFINLILLHCVSSRMRPEDLNKKKEIMARHKKKDDVCAPGVSCHLLATPEVFAN